MPLSADWLPVSTHLDPAEDLPGSLDRLGTLLPARGFGRGGERARPEAVTEDARLRRYLEKSALDFKKSFRYPIVPAQILGNQPSSVSLPLEGGSPRVGGTLLTSGADFEGALP